MNDDILLIHQNILKHFQNSFSQLKNHEKKQRVIKKSLKKDMTFRLREKLLQTLKETQEQISDIKSQKSYHFYIMESTPLIEKYKEIIHKPVVVSFFGKRRDVNPETAKIKQEYYRIAEKYVDINPTVIPPQKIKNICKNCGSEELESLDDEEICYACGNINNISFNNTSYKDSERINMSNKYNYDRKTHFKDCINQYQGKQNVNIPQKVYDDLTQQFQAHGLLVDSPDKFTKYSRITRDHISMFLKETGHSRFYEDIVLIHYVLTGNKPNDISHLEPRLLEDFEILTNMYDRKFKKNQQIARKNFINSQYVLFQLLKRYKFPCKKCDFKILHSSDRKSFHDKICREVFRELGWNFTTTY